MEIFSSKFDSDVKALAADIHRDFQGLESMARERRRRDTYQTYTLASGQIPNTFVATLTFISCLQFFLPFPFGGAWVLITHIASWHQVGFRTMRLRTLPHEVKGEGSFAQ
jgi:hypothetical protein